MSTTINFNVFGALKRWSSLDDVTAEINDALKQYDPNNVDIETSGSDIDLVRVKVSQTLDEDFTTLSDDLLGDTYSTILKISDMLQTIDVEGVITNDINDRPDCTIFKQSNGVIRVEHSRVIDTCDSCDHDLGQPYVKMFPSSGRSLESLVA